MKRHIAQKFIHWFKTPFARYIMQLERQNLARILTDRPNQKILLLGSMSQKVLASFLPQSSIYIASNIIENDISEKIDLQVDYQALPFYSHVFDHVILPHTLDISTSFIKVLREVNWVLKPEGTLSILGFNPWSMWGLRKALSIRHKAPWCGHFRSLWRVKEALELLNYDVVDIQGMCFRPPIQKIKFFRFLRFFEFLGKMFFPFACGIYLLHAKKKVYGLTPIRPKWKMIPAVLGKHMPNPTTRDVHVSRNSSDL